MQHLAQRLGARAHEHKLLAELLEDRAEDEQLLRQVVDDQDAGALVLLRGCGFGGVACGPEGAT